MNGRAEASNPSPSSIERDEQLALQEQLHLLPYQREIVHELLNQDGLAVMGKGLGLATVAATLVAIHHLTPDSGGAIIILGASHAQRAQMAAELARLAADVPAPAEVTAELPIRERVALYAATRAAHVTPRIVVVDLLTSRLPARRVAGMLIINAHRALEHSGEAFAVRLLRAGSSAAFVRGLSDDPAALSTGLSTLEAVMRGLHVRHLFLWPRFQHSVQEALSDVDVTELEVELSPGMAAIQQALMTVLAALLRQVQRAARLDSAELAVANAFTKNFDATIRRQLAPVWNTLAAATHALVRDIRTVQDLLGYLLRFNAVSFLRYLQCLRTAAGPRTEWLLHSAAATIFSEAKGRVYKVVQPPPARGAVQAGKPRARPVLEAMPKWAALWQLAEEIQVQGASARGEALAAGHHDVGQGGSPPAQSACGPSESVHTLAATGLNGTAGAGGAMCAARAQSLGGLAAQTEPAVLVVAREKYMLSELRSIIQSDGSKAYLEKLYDMYLMERANVTGRRTTRPAGQQKCGARSAEGAGGRLTRREQGKYKLQMLSGSTEEDSALSAAADAVFQAFDDATGAGTKQNGKRARAPSDAEHSRSGAAQRPRLPGAPAATTLGEEAPRVPGVHFLAMDDVAGDALHEVQPTIVILYDLDLAWIRHLEVYQSLHPGRPVKVYMLSYAESVELAKFQLSASREKQAFLSLIRKKAHMVAPVDEAGDAAVVAKPSSELARTQMLTGPRLLGNALTRRAGGAAARAPSTPQRVVVDIREFVSQLPAVLHGRGFEICPVTLEVADFVLTPSMCVERKAIPDLISSLDSGRLYSQAISMTRHYRAPVLLLEFDPSRAFAMQSTADLGPDIRVNNVTSKLVLLLLHFPSLRLVWSRSLHATADMFHLLKLGEEEPEAEVAAGIGLQDEEAAGSQVVNGVARDMLLRMPGVVPGNVHKLMEAAGSLAGLADLPLEELESAVGSKNGKALHTFLHSAYRAPD